VSEKIRTSPFNQASWTFLGISWNTTLDHQLMFLKAREDFNSVIFREVVIIASWNLWCHCNDIIFYGASLSFSAWHRAFIHDLKAVTLRVKPQLKMKLDSFLSSLL
jgi:hypothetical protein